MKNVILVTVTGVLAAALVFPQSSQSHELKLLPQNVHWGYYDATVKPVLRVASGDTLRVETMVARGLQRLRAAGVPDADIPNALKVVESTVTERGPGAHPLTGPIWIEGAEPGDVLEVKILGFEFLHPYGVTGFVPNNGTLLGLIRFRGHFPKGGYDVQNGIKENGTTRASTVHRGVYGRRRPAGLG